MNREFEVVFEREEDGGYSVYVPALPGCASQGDTLAEATKNVREAISLYLDGLSDSGLTAPSNQEPPSYLR